LQVKLTELEQSLAEKTEKMNEAESKIEASTKRADHLKNDYKQIEVFFNLNISLKNFSKFLE